MAAELHISLQAPDPNRPYALEVSVEFDQVAGTRSPFSLPTLMECFARFGAEGGFAGVRFQPQSSSLQLQTYDSRDGHANWSFEESDCVPETLGVLAGLLRYSHRNVNALKRAIVTSRLRPSDGLHGALRGCAPTLAFEISVERDAKDVQLSVELCDRPDIAARAELASLLVAWQFLASAGAFETAASRTESPLLIVDRKPAWVSESLSVQLDEAVFDDVAFDALFNALQSYHRNVAPIRSVEVA